MNGFKKNLSSSTPIKPSVTPRSTSPDLRQNPYLSKECREINEVEEQNVQQNGSKMQNPKKSTTKNFMSPTISAASKASVPRKILIEKNEISTSLSLKNNFQESPHFDSKPTSSPAPKFDDGDEQNNFVSDYSFQHYDPLTNYLSPRPKFLRYKPNRRLENFVSKKPIAVEALIDAYTSSSSLSNEDSVNQKDGSSNCTDKLSSEDSENEESEKDEEEDDGDIEEVAKKHSIFNQVLKHLILFGVLMLSTLYISSMNSPTPPPSLQAFRNLKEGYQRLFEAAFESYKVSGNFFRNNQGIREESETVINEGFDEIVNIFELQIGDTTDDFDEIEKIGEFSDNLAEKLGLQSTETAEVSEPNWIDYRNAEVNSKEEEHSEPMNFKAISMAEQAKVEAITESRERISTEKTDVSSSEKENAESNVDAIIESTERIPSEEDIGIEETVEDKMEKIRNIPEEFEARDSGTEDMITYVSRTEFISRTMADENTDYESFNLETEKNVDKETISMLAVGFSILSAIVAIMILGFLRFAKDSSQTLQSSMVCKVDNKNILELPKGEDIIEKDGDFYPNPSSTLVNSEEKSPKKRYQSRAPTVELLGEYVVGGEIRSSLKSCSLKSKTEEAESHISVSREKKSRRKALSPLNMQASSLGFSATGSASCGSFIAPEKFVRLRERRDGEEVMKVIITPVRRSSRIRNQATSPTIH